MRLFLYLQKIATNETVEKNTLAFELAVDMSLSAQQQHPGC